MDLNATSKTLTRELDWLDKVIETVIARHFQSEEKPPDAPKPPSLQKDRSDYAKAIKQGALDETDRLILILAMAPTLRAEVLDPFLFRNPNIDRIFTEFSARPNGDGTFVPTLGTAQFLIGGGALEKRLSALEYFQNGSRLVAGGFLMPLNLFGEAKQHQPLHVVQNFLSLMLTGTRHRPDFQADFPAKRLKTKMTWEDLILTGRTRHEVGEILAWIEHGEVLERDDGIGRLIKPGYRSLFHGPPGTGKTLTATLLGQRTDRDVYRVDLSMVVSKWIGETEKNLALIFDQAEGQNWILFFDEADALFGKRTEVSQSHDRYANQEVSYILQRIEDFDGVIILASNFKSNIDSAFARRFQSMIRFELPRPPERLRLWKAAFPDRSLLATDVDLEGLAKGFELSGGAIVNAARYAYLARLRNQQKTISRAEIRTGITRELQKMGKIAGANE